MSERFATSLCSSRVVACFAVATLVTTGCSGDRASEPPPVPLLASITAANLTLVEESSEKLDLNVSLTPTPERPVTLSLISSGIATEGLDFLVEPTQLRFAVGQARQTATVRAIDDFVEEATESFTIQLGNFPQSVSAAATSSVTFTIDQADHDTPDEAVTPAPELWLFSSASYTATTVEVENYIRNFGLALAPSATMIVRTYEINPDTGELTYFSQEDRFQTPPLEPRSDISHTTTVYEPGFKPNHSYYIVSSLESVEGERGELPNYDYIGVSLDAAKQIRTTCLQTSGETPGSGTDPLFQHQWSLRNTGQEAYAEAGGQSGEDIGMAQVLNDGNPTGEGVTVAIVDTGLEICHPDLQANILPGGSYNFLANPDGDGEWFGAQTTDPFNPSATGDHGTAVAGVVAAVGDNGIGIRGVAPGTSLVAYNYLLGNCCFEDAMGGSTSNPNSAAVDVFNMSFGRFGGQYNEPLDSVISRGVRNLRDGLGAVYVKAAGNAFERGCFRLRHPIADRLGCMSTNGSSTQNQPFVISVAALNAAGDRASYSSAGPNLWVAAPAGQWGQRVPATVTTDQMGMDRGYDVVARRGLALSESDNLSGSYISTFNGTSSAAPHVSGVVALLLDENPGLTWRDVKHVLANTARRPEHHSAEEVLLALGDSVVTAQRDWTTNSAGYSFHNWFGFGAVDVDAALAFLRSGFVANQLGEFVLSDWVTSPTDRTLTIPDFNGAGIEDSLFVSLDAGRNIEAVQVHLEGAHEHLPEIGIELTSPRGTTSVINPIFNNALGGSTRLEWQVLSNAFYGEDPAGTWTIKIFDAAPEETGSFEGWAIRFWTGDHS